eukprot:m.147662 g.147662  ORF g.147662 m.147662 type:complete len:112 (+) comp14187_c0_seq2:939-1274(+)
MVAAFCHSSTRPTKHTRRSTHSSVHSDLLEVNDNRREMQERGSLFESLQPGSCHRCKQRDGRPTGNHEPPRGHIVDSLTSGSGDDSPYDPARIALKSNSSSSSVVYPSQPS